MSSGTIALIVVLVTTIVVGLAVYLVYLFYVRPIPNCSSCHRQRVVRRANCPFCGAVYDPDSTALLEPQDETSREISPAVAQPRLMCLEGDQKGEEFFLVGNKQTIGRAAESSFVIRGLMVSRHHVEIEQRNGSFVLKDAGSTNGTFVNRQRVLEIALQSGDQIQIGDAVFVFQIGVQETGSSGGAGASGLDTITTDNRGVALERELGTYKITGTIGSGGAATVYRGLSIGDNTPVAIKVLQAMDPEIRKKFREEGEFGKRLRHQYIAQIYHYGERDGTAFIIMEYVDGGSLRLRLNGRPAPFDFTRVVIGMTCEALNYAHGMEVIHRDIKPENIMLSTQGNVKVVDFGIARWTTPGWSSSQDIKMGTPQYMSYEQCAGLPVSRASDIYSLGVVLYEMLTGVWPFGGEKKEIIRKHIETPPPPPRAINQDISLQVETVVLRALEKDASRRYQTALQMADALGYQPGATLQIEPIDPSVLDPLGRLGPHSNRSAKSLPREGSVLIAVAGATKGKIIPIRDAVIGRGEIDIADLQISRQHLRVFRQAGHFYVEDVGSSNGTFVNHERIVAPRALKAGDLIRVGHTVLRFES